MNELLQKQSPNRGSLDVVLVIAPGAFYREHPKTGADGKSLCQVAETLGCRTHVIPTQSVGSAAVNGQIICDWLERRGERNIILCSLSKGGADVKMALAKTEAAAAAFRNVVAWINVGGITAGSPMATWILGRPLLAQIYRALFSWRGQDFGFVRELVRRNGSAFDFEINVPPHIKAIHVLGFPLSHHFRRRPSRRWHRRLARWGPNDGATILADSCNMPGFILPIWGADHYLNTNHTPEKLLAAILRYLGDELNLYERSTPSVPLAASAAAT
jgi:hypothetical protein